MQPREFKIKTGPGIKESLQILLARNVGSRAAQLFLGKGFVFVDEEPGHPDQTVSSHSRVRIRLSAEYLEKRAEMVSERIICQDDLLLAINKRPGIEVLEERELALNSLAFDVALYAGLSGGEFIPLHRLDYETSGALLFAKSSIVLQEMRELFAARKIRKEYIVLVKGFLREPEKLAHDLVTGDGKRVRALSSFSVIRMFPREQVTLLRVGLITGRFHQIRLQLAQRNHPVVMDSQHGDFRFNREFRRMFKLQRQFLHCHRMAFGFRSRDYDILAPLEKDLERCLEKLGLPAGQLSD